jgi:hypothetical protein
LISFGNVRPLHGISPVSAEVPGNDGKLSSESGRDVNRDAPKIQGAAGSAARRDASRSAGRIERIAGWRTEDVSEER